MTSATGPDVAEVLPNYADVVGSNSFHPESPIRSHFKTGLQDEKGYAWLTLQISNRSPTAESVPFFLEGDTITGIVHLDAEKNDSVKAVYIEVVATTTTLGHDPKTFLSLKEMLWSHEDTSTGKLKGKHDWPYQFTLPKEVEVVDPRGKKGFYQLPPSFSERASPAYLDYRIKVTIKRGMLKPNETLTTTIIYQTLTMPDSAPSSLRSLAYAERNPIPGPKQDPEGWKVLPKRTVEGILFGERDVKVDVQLSLAKPVQYALGSPIPLHLVLESEDSQVLELLSSPTAMRIELIRAITMGSEATDDSPDKKMGPHYAAAISSRAYFWNVREPGEGSNCRILQGEIDLDMGLEPTFIFPRLSIEYSIIFEGFKATGWRVKPHDHGFKGPLFEEAVKITSRQLPGVSMQSVAPPGYQKPEIDHVASVEYLLNANNRLMHLGQG